MVIPSSNERQRAFVLNYRGQKIECYDKNRKKEVPFLKKLNSRNYYKIYLLGLTIPPTIRARVIKQWLSGYSRDQIAKDNQIGAGTVSSIVKQHKGEQQDYDNDSDYKFDLTRE